jgi:hypothetical protein
LAQKDMRILNYLVHDYLKSNGYKMTALTFIDENDDQNLEDWQELTGVSRDVVPPPIPLLALFESWLSSGGGDNGPARQQTANLNEEASALGISSQTTENYDSVARRTSLLKSSTTEDSMANSLKDTNLVSEQQRRPFVDVSPVSGWSNSFSLHLMRLIPNVLINKRAVIIH